jgi:hypothetical protein
MSNARNFSKQVSIMQPMHLQCHQFTRGGRGGFGRGRGNDSQENNYISRNPHSNLQCQLCGKKGHVVQKCFKWFNHSFSGEEKIAAK